MIKKYTDFITEKKVLDTSLPVLDAVINNDGSIATDGHGNNIKGHVIQSHRKGENEIIVDEKWNRQSKLQNYKDGNDDFDNEYIGGIDKNGVLVGFEFRDNQLVNRDGDIVKRKGKAWERNEKTELNYSIPEYPKLIDVKTTGWVNVKVDEEVIRKVKRFSKNLSPIPGVYGLVRKLKALANPEGIRRSESNFKEGTQKKISSLLLLRYLKEMKDHFTATSAGFLFESFIGGLLDGFVPDDNSKADVVGHSADESYQIKFFNMYGKSNSDIGLPRYFKADFEDDFYEDGIKLKKYGNSKYLNAYNKYKESSKPFSTPKYWIICLKEHNRVSIYNLQTYTEKDGRKDSINDKRNFMNNFTTYGGLRGSGTLSISKLINSDLKPIILDLADLDERISIVGENLKNTLHTMWTNISELEYNVESITTGVNKDNDPIDDDDYDELYDKSNNSIKILEEELEKLKGSMESED